MKKPLQQVQGRPNIIVVLTDDQGYGDLGCHGNPIIKTPAIDRFHSRAARCTQFHSGTTCAPTRSGLLTGFNCNSAGVWHTIGGASLLRRGLKTLPEVLRENGYATGLFGKWHLGDDYPYRPQDRGFETTVYHRGGGISQVSDHWGNNYMDDTYLVNGTPQKFKGYCTDVFFGEALKFIEERKSRPFCCFITPNAPHLPFNVEKKYRDLYDGFDIPEDRKRFYGMITNIDENFQRLEDHLQTLGLEENTILIFMTDNGTCGGCELDADQFVTAGFNAGMRGKKGSPYDGGHRVPFFMRYPAGGIGGGQDINCLANYTDFMPTLLDLCSIDCPDVEGKSLRPLLTGSEISGDWKERALITDTQRIPYPIKWRLSSVMKDKWRLICGRELYDIEADPEQRRDIAVSRPEIVAELRKDYETWWQTCSRQFNEISPVHIGSEECPQVDLTTMELRNENSDVVWHQGQVRAGDACLGWWDILAEQPGLYEITLRRWPEEAGYAVCAGIERFDTGCGPDGFLAENTLYWYKDGKALDISGAALKIDGESLYQDLAAGSVKATFRIELEKGLHTVRAWFSGGTNVATSPVMAPYYVTIRRGIMNKETE
jgi:arylsulfatase A-like enzyme